MSSYPILVHACLLESSYSLSLSFPRVYISRRCLCSPLSWVSSSFIPIFFFKVTCRGVMASEGLDCPICCERFDEEKLCPRLLSCGHSFCSNCLEKLFKEYAISCPTCRCVASVQAGVTGLPKNFALLDVLQAIPLTTADGNADLRLCEVCDDEKHPATSCCLDCKEDMCKDVARWHTRQKATRDHRVVSLEKLKANPKLAAVPIFCPEHNEQYHFFDE